MPDGRLAVHQGLRDREVARGLPLDEVAGDRERAAAEADDGLLRLQLAADGADRVEDGPDRLGRIRNPERLDCGEGTDGLPDDRADTFDELDVDPHRHDRGHDVREHHGRVDAVTAHRLERDLCGQLCGAVDLEERVVLADLAVLGQRPAGLPHEPDRGALDRLAPRGAHEERFHTLTLDDLSHDLAYLDARSSDRIV